MNITLLRSLSTPQEYVPPVNLIQGLKIFANRIRQLCQLLPVISLTLILSLTGIEIPGLPLTTIAVAQALPAPNVLPPKLIKNSLRNLQTPGGSFISSGSSFLSDNSIIRNSFAAKFIPTAIPTITSDFAPNFAPVFAPMVSLFGRVDFFFDAQEINLINFNIGNSKSQPSPALDFYKQGLEKSQEEEWKDAVKYYSNALSKDGNFAEAYASRGRAYSEFGTKQGDIEYLQKAIVDCTKALHVKPKFAEDPTRYVEPLLGRGAVYLKLNNYQAALDDFSLAIQFNPDFCDAYLGRATIYD